MGDLWTVFRAVPQRWRRLAGTSLVAALVASSTMTATAGAYPTTPPPSFSQLQTLIASSLQSHAMPNLSQTIPPLWRLSTDGVPSIPSNCFNVNSRVGIPSNASTRCAFGDRRSTRRIVLFGDDTASMWFPAINVVAKHLHWRLIFLGREKCSPRGAAARQASASCRRFVQSEINFVNADHPRLVIPIGSRVAWIGDKSRTISHLEQQINATLDKLAPSRSHVVLFQPIPQFNQGFTSSNPATCLIGRLGRLRRSESSLHAFLVGSTPSISMFAVAQSRQLPYVATGDFFCQSLHCSLFVRTPTGIILTYRDKIHMSRIYARWISAGLQSRLGPYLH